MRTPVLKMCGHCGGDGSIGVGMSNGTTSGNYTSWVTCHECSGSGTIETDMFIEYDEPIGGDVLVTIER